MSKLKGNSNVVSYEDHKVIEHKGEIGWDILIRMELLTPMMRYIRNNPMDRSKVIQLGIDICKALELCRKHDIVHRDIKPENIFVSDDGQFKLGDFGIAKTMEQTTGSIGKKGTYNYMAPEVYKGEPYGPRVDIYSLGIVLYRYMNNGRFPFQPAAPIPLKPSDNEKAISKRVNGEELLPPVNADEYLSKIILKACAYSAEDRYASPTEMREDLEALAAGIIPPHVLISLHDVKTVKDSVGSEGKTVPDNRHIHKYTVKVVSPTCTEKGYTAYTCECGESYKDSYIGEIGHDFKRGICTRCGAKDPNYTFGVFGGIPPKPPVHTHNYTGNVVSPTCTEKGYTLHICACGERYTDSYVEALGHNFKNGKCARCGAIDPAYVPPKPKWKYIAAAAGILAAIIMCFVVFGGGGIGQKAEKQLDWTEWSDELPKNVTEEDYLIEELTQYRSREKENGNLNRGMDRS